MLVSHAHKSTGVQNTCLWKGKIKNTKHGSTCMPYLCCLMNMMITRSPFSTVENSNIPYTTDENCIAQVLLMLAVLQASLLATDVTHQNPSSICPHVPSMCCTDLLTLITHNSCHWSLINTYHCTLIEQAEPSRS